ncbi:MAG: nitrile hydratase accessory protein [Pseudomonadota bacterium]
MTLSSPISPGSDPDVPFDAPWQAQLFAMTVAMSEAGLFTWPRWAEAFGAELKAVSETGNAAYYAAWLRALEGFLVKEGHASAEAVAALTSAWQDAARATPHGMPIELKR